MTDYKVSSSLNEAANNQNISEDPDVNLINTSSSYTEEANVLLERPRIYKNDFSSVDPTSDNFEHADAIEAIASDFWDSRPDPVSGDIVVGQDMNGMPVQIFLARRDEIYSDSLTTLTIPSDPDKRFTGYSMDAFVTTQLPPGTINVRSPDESVYIDVEEDATVEGKYWTQIRGLTVNGLKADDQGTEILIVSEDSSIKVHTRGKRINLEVDIPEYRSTDGSIEYSQKMGFIESKALTLNTLKATDVEITSPNASVAVSVVGDKSIELKASDINGLGPVPVTISSPKKTIAVNTKQNAIELEYEAKSSDKTIAFNNPIDPSDLTALSLNGLKARPVSLAGANGITIDVNQGGIITIGGGMPPGYVERQISLCINGQPHTASILLKNLQPA